MKKTIFIASVAAISIFYTGFYAGHKFNTALPSNEAEKNLANLNKTHKTSQLTSNRKQKTIVKNTQFKSISTRDAFDEIEQSPPHEQEWTEETQKEQENLFIANQEAEIELFETMLVSMIENNFPDSEIAEIKAKIEQINSAQFDDSLPEYDDNIEEMSSSQKREDLAESLRIAGGVSNEDIEEMVYSMFPGDESETLMGADEDTSIPHHELNN